MRAPLYILLLIGSFAATGCPKSGSAPDVGKARASEGGTSDGSAGQEDARPRGEVGFAEAQPKSCMLHQEAGAYFSCLSGADGLCFHFGTTCEPASQCMFEAKSALHKRCTESREGTCVKFGDTCEPNDRCMFSAQDKRYRSCEDLGAGRCKKFGPACQPSA